jgi:hypothetical protein
MVGGVARSRCKKNFLFESFFGAKSVITDGFSETLSCLIHIGIAVEDISLSASALELWDPSK